VENRNGLIMSAEVFEANGTAERDAALFVLEQIPGAKPVTLGGDKGYDTLDFVAECRHIWVTPHGAQNDQRRGGSAIDARTTRHCGICHQSKEEKAHRRMLRMAEDNRAAAKEALSSRIPARSCLRIGLCNLIDLKV
jgi:hypothetical protein